MPINEAKPSADTFDVNQALQHASTHHRAGDLQDADLLYRAILKVEPKHPIANHNLGILALQVQQTSVAVMHLKMALESNPNEQQYWLSYINALILTDHLDVARQIFAQGVERGLKGAAVEAIALRLSRSATKSTVTSKHLPFVNQADGVTNQTSRHQQGDVETILCPANKHNAAPPRNSAVTAGKSILEPTSKEINLLAKYINQKCFTKAETLARQITEQFPGHGVGWKALGVVFMSQGRFEESLVPLQQAAQLLPGDAEAHNNLGVILKEIGRLEEAEACYRRTLEIKPAYANAHSNLGNTLMKMGQLCEAEASFRCALTINSRLIEVHHNLGCNLFEQGRYSEAEASFRRALKITPANCEALAELGIVLPALGRLEEAEACLRQSLILLRTKLDKHVLLSSGRPNPRPVMNLEGARQTLFEARSRLMAANLPFFLSNGTLLGIVRNGDLLPHDKDMDIGLPWDVNRHHLLEILCSGNVFQNLRAERNNDADLQFNIALKHRNTNSGLDLFFYLPDGDHFMCSFNCRAQPMTSRPRKFSIGTLDWRGVSWPVPDPTDQYLTDFYGEHWRIPDPYFDTVLSSNCQTPESCDARRVFGYRRLFERLKHREWDKAMGYCRQLLGLRNDDFIQEILQWIKQKQVNLDVTD
jgi:Flp pilus assembly protein TadD